MWVIALNKSPKTQFKSERRVEGRDVCVLLQGQGILNALSTDIKLANNHDWETKVAGNCIYLLHANSSF